MATPIDFSKAANVYYVKNGVRYTATSVKTSDGKTLWPLKTVAWSHCGVATGDDGCVWLYVYDLSGDPMAGSSVSFSYKFTLYLVSPDGTTTSKSYSASGTPTASGNLRYKTSVAPGYGYSYYVSAEVTQTTKYAGFSGTSDPTVLKDWLPGYASYNVNSRTYTGSSQTGLTLTNCTATGNSATVAGNHVAEVTPKDGYRWSDGTTSTKTVVWTIAKATVGIPSIINRTYKEGIEQYACVNGTYYTMQNYNSAHTSTATAEDAGNYSTRLVLNDSSNYMWSDGTSGYQWLDFTIARKQIAKPIEDGAVVTKTYNGSYQAVCSRGVGYDVAGGTDAGSYTCYITLYSNYCWTGGSTDNIRCTLNIEKASAPNCNSIEVTTLGKGTECKFKITFAESLGDNMTYTYEIQREGYSTFTGLTFTLSAGSTSKTVATGKTPTASSGKWTVALKSSPETTNYNSRTYTRTGSKSW